MRCEPGRVESVHPVFPMISSPGRGCQLRSRTTSPLETSSVPLQSLGPVSVKPNCTRKETTDSSERAVEDWDRATGLEARVSAAKIANPATSLGSGVLRNIELYLVGVSGRDTWVLVRFDFTLLGGVGGWSVEAGKLRACVTSTLLSR